MVAIPALYEGEKDLIRWSHTLLALNLIVM